METNNLVKCRLQDCFKGYSQKDWTTITSAYPSRSDRFVKDRYIGENIRLISDIMEQTRKDKIPGILASLDFRKAFDTLEWSCLQHALKLFNFGVGLS